MKENKKSKRRSANYLKCQISGSERMSNKSYIAAKAEKKGVSVDEFKSNYVCKDEYNKIKAAVESSSLSDAADKLAIDRERLKKFLRLNGRGKYVPGKALGSELAVQ